MHLMLCGYNSLARLFVKILFAEKFMRCSSVRRHPLAIYSTSRLHCIDKSIIPGAFIYKQHIR